MPRTRSILWSQLKLGVIGIVAVLTLTVAVIAVGGQGGFPWNRYSLKARFGDAKDLKSGAVVRLNGKEVGKITSVEFSGASLEVVFQVSKDVRGLITTESQASLGSLSLLGETILELKAATTGTPLAEWSYVRSDEHGALGDLTSSAAQSLEEMSKLMGDVRAGRGSVGKLFTDPALYNEVRDLAGSAAVVAGYLKDGKGTLGGLAKDPAVYNELKASLEQLHTITRKIDTGQGPLGKLLNDEVMAKSLASTSANFEQISARLNRGEGSAGKLLTDKELYDRFTNVATRLDQLVSGVEGGQGTAGKLLKDKELYDNLNKAVSELNALIGDIRKDPKKYLNVRVSIF